MIRFLASILMLLVSLAPALGAEDRHIVVITIDGLPAYLLDDPQASLPVLRGLRESGASAKGMHVVNPSVTWPNHTTLMTGVYPEQHGVLYNGVLDRKGPGQPVGVSPAKTQQELVRVPLLFDTLKARGLESAAINWPCTRGSESIADNFPDVPDMLRYTTPRLKEELAARGLLQRFEHGSGPARDEVWTEAACEVIRKRMPSLLVLHLLNLDSTHHRHGPRTPEGYTAAALTDALVGRVLDAIDEAGLRDKTTVIVVSDHGFIAITKSLLPNALLRKEGLLKVEGRRIVEARAQVVPEGGIGMVYLTDPKTIEEDRSTVRRLFEGAEGIVAVLGPEDYARYHFPQPNDQEEMADLVLVAKPGYTITGSALGDDLMVAKENQTGSHGFLSTEPQMNAVFVASGAGIKAGAKLEAIDNVDVAPTVAHLLGFSLDGASGRVLKEILEDQK